MLISITSAALANPTAVLPDSYVAQHVKPAKGDADLVGALRNTAIDWIERRTGKSMERRAWTATFDGRNQSFRLPRGPVVSIASILCSGASGAPIDVTLLGTILGDVVRVALPSYCSDGTGIIVQFVAGYASVAAEAPSLQIAAVMLLRHLYDGGTTDEVPATVLSLVDDPFRTPVIA